MLGIGDAEPDGDGDIGNCTNARHNGIQIGSDARTGTRNAQRAYTVNETFRFTRNGIDAFLGCGRNHADKVHTMLATRTRKLFLFFKGNIGKDKAIHTRLSCANTKLFDAVMEHHVCIGHEHKRRIDGFAQIGNHIKHLIGGGSCPKRTHIG